MNEKRKHKRLEVERRMLILLYYPRTRKKFMARIVNISSGGLCFETSQDIRQGEKFIMEFQFFVFKPLKVVGHVAWSRKNQTGNYYGIHFDRVGFFSRARLNKGLHTYFKTSISRM